MNTECKVGLRSPLSYRDTVVLCISVRCASSSWEYPAALRCAFSTCPNVSAKSTQTNVSIYGLIAPQTLVLVPTPYRTFVLIERSYTQIAKLWIQTHSSGESSSVLLAESSPTGIGLVGSESHSESLLFWAHSMQRNTTVPIAGSISAPSLAHAQGADVIAIPMKILE